MIYLVLTLALCWETGPGDDRSMDRRHLASESRAIVVDPEDHFFIAGRFEGNLALAEPVETQLIGQGQADGFLARYDESGTCQWAHGIGSAGVDEALSLCLTPDGDPVVIGFFTGEITLGKGEHVATLKAEKEEAEHYLARYTKDGDLLWAKNLGQFAGTSLGLPRFRDANSYRGEPRVACNDQGQLLVVGASITEESPHYQGVLIVLDANGEELRRTSLGDGVGAVFPRAIAPLGKGCVIGGRMQPTGPDGGVSTLYLAGLDDEGTVLWSRWCAGETIMNGRDRNGDLNAFDSTGTVMAIDTDARGMIYAAGSMRGQLDFDPDSRGKGDTLRANGSSRLGFVLRVTPAGKFQAVFPVDVDGPGETHRVGDLGWGTDVRGIAVGDKGSFHVTGVRSGQLEIQGRDWVIAKLFARKYRSNGRPVWSTLWDTKKLTASAAGLDAALGSDGRLLVAGFGQVEDPKRVIARQGPEGVVLGFTSRGKVIKRKR